MRVRLDINTRQALQVTVAVGLIGLLAYWFPLKRPYWAIFTAVAVLCQTWGESMRKGWERVSATLAGVAAASVLNDLMVHWPAWHYISLVLGLFMMVYTVGVAYGQGMFWMSWMVVSLFSLIGAWSLDLIWVRVYQTALGVGVAVLTGLVVFPLPRRRALREELQAYLKNLEKTYQACMQRLIEGEANAQKDGAGQKLSREFEAMRRDYQSVLKDRYFLRQPPRESQRWIIMLEVLSLYVMSLEDVSRVASDDEVQLLRDDLKDVRDIVCRDFAIIQAAVGGGEIGEIEDLEPLRPEIRAHADQLLAASEAVRRETMALLPVFYYNRRLIAIFQDMAERMRRRARERV